jgi:hypothetical protein
MMTEVEEDQQTWEETDELNAQFETDPANAGMNALQRASQSLHEATTLSACTPLIQSAI